MVGRLESRRGSMKAGSHCVSNAELQAYVDGLLDPDERSRVEAFLSSSPEERERLEAYRRQNMLLHRLYDWPGYRAPSYGQDALLRKLSRKMQLQRYVLCGLRVASVAGVLVLVAVGSWASYEWVKLPTGAVTAFNGNTEEHYMMLVGDGGQAATLDRNSQAIAKKSAEMLNSLSAKHLTMPRRAPDLERAGFRLIGTRVLSTAIGPAIQFLYGNKENSRVALFLRPNADIRSSGSTVVENGDVSMIYSEFENMAYSLVGNVDRQTLLKLAALVSKTFTTVEAPPASPPPPAKSPAKADPARHGTPAPTRDPIAPTRSLERKDSTAPKAQPASPSVIKAGLRPQAR